MSISIGVGSSSRETSLHAATAFVSAFFCASRQHLEQQSPVAPLPCKVERQSRENPCRVFRRSHAGIVEASTKTPILPKSILATLPSKAALPKALIGRVSFRKKTGISWYHVSRTSITLIWRILLLAKPPKHEQRGTHLQRIRSPICTAWVLLQVPVVDHSWCMMFVSVCRIGVRYWFVVEFMSPFARQNFTKTGLKTQLGKKWGEREGVPLLVEYQRRACPSTLTVTYHS